MSYASPGDFESWIDNDRMVRLTDDNGTGIIDDAISQAVLDSASAKIDGYLSPRYTLPFAEPVPPVLQSLCVDIGGYYLHIRREDAPGEFWQKQYDDAIAFLQQVAAGDVGLGAEDPEGTGHPDKMQAESADKIFTRSVLDRY